MQKKKGNFVIPCMSWLMTGLLLLQGSFAEAADEPATAGRPRPTKVTFDVENTMFVDGRPFIPVFTWHGGNAQVALLGENITRRLLDSDPAYWRRLSPTPYAFIRATTLEKDWQTKVKTHVPFVRNQPDTLIYFLTHEPGFAKEPPEQVNELARMIRELDPDHPSFVHIGGDNPIRSRAYSQESKILSISGMGISPALSAVKVARAQLVTEGQKSIWPCLHAFMPEVAGYSTDNSARVDPRTLKAGLYASLISGAKGISLYAPDHYVEWLRNYRPANPRKMDDVIIKTYQSINGLMDEVRFLTPIIASPTPKQSYSVQGGNGRVISLLKAVGGELYLLSVNHTTDSFDATFDMSAITKGAEFEVRAPFEDETAWFGRRVKERDSNGTFTDRFGPLDVHVYQITSRADLNQLKPSDASFDPPLETPAERFARLQAIIDRLLPSVIYSPIEDRDPMFFDEVDGVRRFRLESSLYARPLALKPLAAAAPRPVAKREPNNYSDVTRFYLVPKPGASVSIRVADTKNDASTVPALLLIDPEGKETKRYATSIKDPIVLKFGAGTAGGVYTLVVKSRGHHVTIDGCPWVIDGGTAVTYTGDGTTLYFHVPAGVSQFSVTSMVAKGPKKGVGEGNMIEVLDPAGRVVGQAIAHYLERMLPMEEGGGERQDWQPAINDPGPANVTVTRSEEEAKKNAVYAVRLGPPKADPALSYVSTFYLRLDSPLPGLLAERPEDLLQLAPQK